jgi:hypothetical protein
MSDEFDLRSFTEDEEAFPFDEEDEDDFSVGEVSEAGGSLFLGMTPVERMFLSIFLFMNVAILGVALLLATNRI